MVATSIAYDSVEQCGCGIMSLRTHSDNGIANYALIIQITHAHAHA